MNEPTSTPTPAVPVPTPRPRRSRWIVWVAGALALLLVLVLLAPTLLSGFAASRGAAAFGSRYQGRLAIGEADFAWFGPQTVRDVRVSDPQGVEILRASATLPSLWTLVTAGGKRFGTIVVDLEADLVADDAGTTNLQRALAPREPEPEPRDDDADEGGPSVAERLRDLDVDLRVNARRVTWSDAGTRRLGTPFEIKNGVITAVAKPGQPIVARVAGDVAGAQPGRLEADATVHGPIDLTAPWPLGRMEARANVAGFSTAMVDGLAGLDGALLDVLGPTFALTLDANATATQEGNFALTLDGESADLAVRGALRDGRVIAVDEPFLVATLPFPRALLERLAAPKLPPGTKLALADAGKPWTVRVPRLVMPLPDPKARDLAAMKPALDAAEIELEVDLPGSVVVETEALRAAGVSAGVSGIRLTARAQPGQPLVAQLDAALSAARDAGAAPSRLHVEATVPQPFAMLAGGALPPVDLDARIEGLSTLALGELAGQGPRLAAALGPVASVSVEARRANLDGGDLRLRVQSAQLDADVAATIAGGSAKIDEAHPAKITWTASPEFVAAEVAPKLPPGSSAELAGPLVITIATLSAPLRDGKTGKFAGTEALLAGLAARVDVNFPEVVWTPPAAPESEPKGSALPPARVRAAVANLTVAPGAAPELKLGADVQAGGASSPAARLDVVARPRETLAQLAAGAPGSGAIDLTLRGLDAATLEQLAGQPDRIAPLFGPKLDVVAHAEGPDKGVIDAKIEGANGRVALKGRIVDGKFVAQGDEGLTASFQATPELLAAQLGPSLPEGTRVELAGSGPGAITATVRDVSVPLEAPDLWQRLAATSAKLDVALPSIAYADAKTSAAKSRVVLADTRLTAALAPSAKPALKLSSRVEGTPPGELSVDFAALEPLAKLGETDGWKTYRADLAVRAANVPTAIVDALAGQDGLLVDALGDRIQVEVTARDVSMQKGAFETRFESAKHKIALAGRLEEGELVVDKADGLDANVALGPIVMERVVGRLMPILGGAQSLVAGGQQELVGAAAFAPFQLKSDHVRFALGKDLSKLSGDFHVDLGKMSFRGLPMLEQLGLSLKAAEVKLPAFTVPVRDGVASYTGLPIRVGAHELRFDGSVRLTDGVMELGTRIPLSLFGKSVDRELDKVRDFLPPDTSIPVVISGTWNKPRLKFQEGFLQELLESAAGRAAEKGLDDVLDGLLGGKKKKKP